MLGQRFGYDLPRVAATALAASGVAFGACATRESPQPSAADRGSRATPSAPASRPPTPRTAGPPNARVLVAVEGDNRLAVLDDPPRWRVVRRIRVPAGPHNIAASSSLGLAAVTSPPADRVTVFDAAARVVARARVSGAPHDAAFVARRRVLWVSAENARRLVALDPRTGRQLRTVVTSGRPHDLAVSPDGRSLWVTIDAGNAVEIREASSGRLLRRAVVGGTPHDLAFAPGERRIWLSNVGSSLLTVTDSAGRRTTSLRAGIEPHHFAFGLQRLWASDNSGGVLLRIAPDSRRILGRTRVGPAPHHVTIAAGEVLVAVHGSGRVAIVERSGRLRSTVRVGAGPHGIVTLPVR